MSHRTLLAGTLLAVLLAMVPASAQEAGGAGAVPGSPTGQSPTAAGDAPPGRSPEGSATGESDATARGMQPAPGSILGSDLMGEDVLGADGKSVGSVADMVIDPATGTITHIVLKSGGVLGLGGKAVLVDRRVLTIRAGQGITSKLTADTAQRLPELDEAAIATLDASSAPGGTAK